jgi:hypothetical protein
MKYILLILSGIFVSLYSSSNNIESSEIQIQNDTIIPGLIDTIYTRTITIICYYEYRTVENLETGEPILIESYNCDTIY